MKAKNKEDVTAARSKRAQEEGSARAKQNAPALKARDIRNSHTREQQKAAREEQLDKMAKAEEDEKKKAPKPHLLDGKPGSGAGLKPGDWFAPKSNPGAAAQVPSQPLQPESMQSHGKGIIYDKDLDNPPYNEGDPLETDAGPSGSGSPSNIGEARGVDKKAERAKAEKATSKSKTMDPDNPTEMYRGKDATASPKPIGTHKSSKSDVAGGSNSGSEA